MKKIILIILLAVTQMHAAQVGLSKQRIVSPMQQLQEKYLIEKNQKALFIILNENLEAYPKESMQSRLECFLRTQNFPIITKKNLLIRVVDSNPDIFKKNKWFIKKCDNYVLLVPFEQIEADESIDLIPGLPSHELTDLEKKLGLKINHLETLDHQIFVSNETNSSKIVSRVVDTITGSIKGDILFSKIRGHHPRFNDVLSKIFVVHTDIYPKGSHKEIHKEEAEWVIMAAGHGGGIGIDRTSFWSVIADFSLTEFKKMMDFFKRSLSIKVVFIQSCSIGKNIAQDVFTSENLDNTIQQAYPFDIIFSAMGDEYTYFEKHACEKGAYSEFIKKINATSNPDYYTILNKTIVQSHSENPVPQIRYKITEYFLPVYALSSKIQDALIISNVMAATRKEPLIIKRTIKNVVLYSPVISFPIKLAKEFFGNWYYKFKPSVDFVSSFFENKVIRFFSLEIEYPTQLSYKWKQLDSGKLGIFCDLLVINDWASVPYPGVAEQQLREIFPGAKNVAVDPTRANYLLGKVTLYNVAFTKEAVTGMVRSPDNREYIVIYKDGSIMQLSPADSTKKKQDYIVAFEKRFGKIPQMPESMSKLEELFKKHSAAAAVGRLVTS